MATEKIDKGGEYTSSKESSCQTCKHRSTVNPQLCLAFPKGIPVKILMGATKHKKAYPGDNGIQWEKK